MSEDTQINISTTTEIVNVDITETLQPVSLECHFAQSSASDTIIDVTESIQNIELNVTETEAQNVEIDFYYPTGPQGTPGVSLWGTISGNLSAQTDLWSILSSVGTSNFDTQTLIKYLSTTPVILSSINVKGQILSAGKDLFDIFVTSAGSDSQTLTYVPSSYLLSIVRGNTVNLSSINSTFAANSGKYESVYSTVFNTSANWNTAYNISTAYRTTSASFATNTALNSVSSVLLPTSVYQNASSSFVTNTTLNSVSSLLTPLTLTNTLTGQLVTNTVFNNYQTSVANTTATLLPTSIYQNASGSFVSNTTLNSISSLLLPTSVYQNASGSFATNTTLNSVSSLLTPLTLTNTLTSQLVTNTTLNSVSSLLTPLTLTNTLTSQLVTNTTLNSVSSLLLPTSIYQNASSSFVTNTTLNSVSSLLTPLTLTNTLTGQLITNTTFTNYQTSVANTTATLLPTSVYQNASGNWQGTFTTVQTNSANWNTAYTLITSTSGYGILTSSVTTDLSVGGISAAQVLPAGTTFQTFVEQLFLKTYYPTFTAPSISIGSSIGTSIESGTTGLTITVTFLSGSINGKTVGGIWDPNLKQDNRSGILTGGQIFNTQLAKTTYNTIVSTSATRVIVDGSNTFSVRADYEQGPQPKDSKGNNFSTSLPASSVPGSITITGFRRAFYGSDTLTTRPSSSDQVRSLPGSTNNPGNGTVFTISVPAGTTRVVFAYPDTLRNVTSVWDLGNYQPYVSSFGSPEIISVSGANNFSPISYKVYTYFPSIPFGNAITLTVTI